MSRITLGSNIASLQVQRRLAESTAGIKASFERLSSGLRINRASDDAAGLSLAKQLNVDARVYTQAVRNVNDGISFLNVADGAVSALKDILLRMRELSTQSSNGTLSNPQRQSLDKESQALQAECGRILDTTSFNGIRVFGSDDLTVQAGFGTKATLLAKLAGSVSTGDGTLSGITGLRHWNRSRIWYSMRLKRRRQE